MEYEKMKRKLLVTDKKIRNLEDLVENNTRELFLYNQELLSKNKLKDTLLKEIHDRVNSNLHIITRHKQGELHELTAVHKGLVRRFSGLNQGFPTLRLRKKYQF